MQPIIFSFKKINDESILFRTIEILLEAGANPNVYDQRSMTPLMFACKRGSLKMVETLISHGASIKWEEEKCQECSSFDIACNIRNLDIVHRLIKEGADINIVGNSPLMIAAERGDLELVNFLIDAGMKINDSSTTWMNCSDNPLYFACKGRNVEILKIFLKSGLDVNICDNYESTLLFFAIKFGNLEIVRTLFEAGSVTFDPNTGKDAATFAKELGQIEIGEYLIDHI